MFKALFLASLLVTLLVNLIFLLASKQRPPVGAGPAARRLFSRSNADYYAENEVEQEPKQKQKQQSDTDSERALLIEVSSSKDQVQVHLNGRLIYESGPEDEPGRGLHVLALHQRTGQLLSERLFDTYAAGQHLELAAHLEAVRPDRLLVVAVRDEASFQLPADSPARLLLERLGSLHVGKLGWRDMWAIVLRKRPGGVLAETLARSPQPASWAPPVRLEVRIEPEEEAAECEPPLEPSESQAERARRLHFCANTEGYEKVCDCRQPAPISFQPEQQPSSGWRLEQVPVVVVASNRPHYLNRMLRSLLQARGLQRAQVSVFIDGQHEEPRRLAQLYGVRAFQRRALGRRSARISQHYLQTLSATFEQLQPNASYAIVFEEDLEVAPDALVYFNQTLAVLERDPSLYCASAWNDQGYQHSVGDPRRVYRVETMPGLGWLLSRRLFELELKPHWPSANQSHDWDMWLRTRQVRRGRECLIPDVSRTYHFGATGTNINAHFQRQYFSQHAFQSRDPVDQFAQLERLLQPEYERLMERLVAEGAPLDGRQAANATQFLCSLATAASNGTQLASGGGEQQHRVIYISMIDEHHFANWLALASCWRLWDLDARGQHKSAWRLYLAGRPTLVVGVPASPYARFKPAHLEPFSLTG